ncbi:MAG: dihydroorotase [Saprospiraceae bacterium]|nr:dihydroorotase [Saprospiraceae bacterium]
MDAFLIKNATLVNEGRIVEGDLLLKNGRIAGVGGQLDPSFAVKEIDATGLICIPGIIDDQVHFREPGLEEKATIQTESRAALSGGVTTFMEMPNTNPAALTQRLLQDKYDIAERTSFANYSFFMGASNDNIEEIVKTDIKQVCGIKVFMGSSTGNMLVDDEQALESIFANSPMLVATHCEDELTIKENLERLKRIHGEHLQAKHHPMIRSVEGCLKSSSYAVRLAKKHHTRLHILHISTEEELSLFSNSVPLGEKKITSEVCVHHLYFDAKDYGRLGNKVKCNPAIKEARHKEHLFAALLDGRLDIIATDHAPHLLDEKERPYLNAPSGLPLVQHSLSIMLDFYHQGRISLEKIVEKMCHAPAVCFDVLERGFLREDYWGDVVLLDPQENWEIRQENIFYKCGWSPLEGKKCLGRVTHTFLNGDLAYERGIFKGLRGKRVTFNRE